MRITKEQLKQIIKEELEEMIDPDTGDGSVKFPELPGFERLAVELTNAFNAPEAGDLSTAPNFPGLEYYISPNLIGDMEDYAYQLQREDFMQYGITWVYAFHDVIKGH